jgi:lipid A disaccharide synthetase
VQRYVSEMLVIIPFEREFYAQNGVQVEFVGHPLSELEPPKVSREEFASPLGAGCSPEMDCAAAGKPQERSFA